MVVNNKPFRVDFHKAGGGQEIVDYFATRAEAVGYILQVENAPEWYWTIYSLDEGAVIWDSRAILHGGDPAEVPQGVSGKTKNEVVAMLQATYENARALRHLKQDENARAHIANLMGWHTGKLIEFEDFATGNETWLLFRISAEHCLRVDGRDHVYLTYYAAPFVKARDIEVIRDAAHLADLMDTYNRLRAPGRWWWRNYRGAFE